MASDIGRTLARIEKRLARLERSSRLASASIEDAAVQVYDADGSLRAIVGQQPDGTSGVNVVNGPTPPTPATPTVEPALAALAITWNGQFQEAQAAPLDWMRCEVHIGTTADFAPDQTTLRDTIETPQGSTVTVPLPYTQWFAKLRSRTTSGVASPATVAVAGTPRKADAPDLVAGAITADHLAADAITGKTITGGTITGSTVLSDDGNGYVIKQQNGRIYLTKDGMEYAVVGPFLGADRDPGIIAYSLASSRYYTLLASGYIQFGRENGVYDQNPFIEHSTNAGAAPSVLSAGSGLLDASNGYGSACWRLTSPMPGQRAKMEIYNNFGDPADLSVTGNLSISGMATVTGPISSDNIRAQRSQTPAPGTGGGTSSVEVVFSNAMSGIPRVTITPDTTVDPATVTIRGYVDNVTTGGFTIRCYRSTNSATNWNWIAISD